MIFAVVAAALLVAFINAEAIILQRRAAGQRGQKELFSHKFILDVARKKLWLASIGLQLVGYIFQVFALNYGPLVLVEPLTTMVLVFLFLILHFRYKIRAGLREWLSATMVTIGLVVMLVAARPQGGHLNYDGPIWAIVIGICFAIIVVCASIVRRSGTPKLRAAVGGIAAAISIGLTAGLTKLTLDNFHESQFGVFGGWEIYALGASALLMAVVLTSVFAAGPLVISQPIIEILNPIVSSIIGVIIFSNVIDTSPAALAFAVPGFLIAAIGIIGIGGSRRYEQSHLAA